MKIIIIINGSPRGEKGNTHVSANEFYEEAKKLGHHIETIFLNNKKINH